MPYSVQVFTLRRSIILILFYTISVVWCISHLADPDLDEIIILDRSSGRGMWGSGLDRAG
jgi:hypothetical protein